MTNTVERGGGVAGESIEDAAGVWPFLHFFSLSLAEYFKLVPCFSGNRVEKGGLDFFFVSHAPGLRRSGGSDVCALL